MFLIGHGVPLVERIEERYRVFGGACVVRSLDHVYQELRRGVVVDVSGFENDAGDRAAGQTAGS